MRSYAREVAFCKLYTFLISGEFDGDFSQFDQDKLTEEDLSFAKMLVDGAIANKVDLDIVIAEHSRQFKLSRIYRLDLAALELALYELKNLDTPKAVVINEAVGFAKKYSTDKSVSFVNGVLSAIAKEI